MNGIIVDGYSSGATLATELRKAGCTLHHVQSSREIPVPYRSSFDASLYASNQTIDAETSISGALFKNIPIDFVATGSEPGVVLADKIGAYFGVKCNNPQTSQLRRNKALMMRRVRECGLQVVDEIVVTEGGYIAEIPSTWFPVVVKPADSAGSDDVRICETIEMARNAIQSTLGKNNIFGLPNKNVVVQRKLEGIQYMVNAMSQNGRHKIIEIWQETRLHTADGHSVFDREILMPSEFPHSLQIDIYVKAVLSALGVQFGPSHTELFMTKEGPILLESASRMQGGIDGLATYATLGYSHISCTRDLLLDASSFETSIQEDYLPRSNMMLVNFISTQSGVINKVNLTETVGRLPSFHSTKGVPTAGQRIRKTVDLCSKPGHVYLVHADLNQIEKDYQAIRTFEKTRAIFEVLEP
jgi:biotin carboxylase